MDVGNLISGSSTFSKFSLNVWMFSLHILLKPGLENFKHYFTSMSNACSCVIIWTFFGIALLWDWIENWPFPVLWPLLSFPNLLAYWVQHFNRKHCYSSFFNQEASISLLFLSLRGQVNEMKITITITKQKGLGHVHTFCRHLETQAEIIVVEVPGWITKECKVTATSWTGDPSNGPR